MVRTAVFLMFIAAACAPCGAATYVITGDGADQSPLSSGAMVWVGQATFRVGGYNSTADGAAVYVFQLPALDADETIVTADFEAHLLRIANNPGGACDLYGLGYRTGSTVQASDFYQGDFGSDTTDAWGLQDDFAVITTPADSIVSTDAAGDATLAAYLSAQYAAGAQGGDWVFLRINPDVANQTNYYYWEFTSANSSPKPVLTIETGKPGPEADAGPDQTIRADLQNHPVTVTLDGSGSTPDDSPIASYQWTETGSPVASGEVAAADFTVGVHTVTLTITDGEGDTDTDDVVVTILDGSPAPPVADAGADQAVPDADGDGVESITLDGTASYAADPRATLVSASWTDGGTEIATGFTATVTFAEGYHPVVLTVTDDLGGTDTDRVNISVGREQLLNLPNDRPAFPVPADIVWPATVGEPHICLWYGDKFAALSITIDDNNLPDQAWWMQMADTYGFTPTWFIIVGSVDSQSNPAFAGVWADYVALDAAGGDVQSHTMTHNCSDDTRPDADVHYEYGQSQALIDANIPGHHCLTIAYPCGVGRTDIAAQYFIAGRGVYGTPNKPAKINWMMTSSDSGNISTDYVHPILYGTSDISWLNSDQWKRAWLCTHFHTVQDRPAEEVHLAYIASLKHLIWWGSFGEVARFGQERDSAEITMVENSASRIAFEITDRMNDLIFDHPLTIKIRIPDAWAGAAVATQGGTATGFTLSSEGGCDYILLDAVPDRGLVEVRPDAAKPGDANGDDKVDLDDFVILKQTWGQNPLVDDRADFNNDGAVNLEDFVVLKQNFGT